MAIADIKAYSHLSEEDVAEIGRRFEEIAASGSHGSWNANMYQLFSAWLLRTMAATIARGWGVDRDVIDSNRSG